MLQKALVTNERHHSSVDLWMVGHQSEANERLAFLIFVYYTTMTYFAK